MSGYRAPPGHCCPVRVPRAPWWRLFRAWATGTFRRLRVREKARAYLDGECLPRLWPLLKMAKVAHVAGLTSRAFYDANFFLWKTRQLRDLGLAVEEAVVRADELTRQGGP